MSEFIAACDGGDLAEVRRRLEAGADPSTVKPSGWALLLSAIGKGNTELAHLLLENGADVNVKDPGLGQTALMLAMANGLTDLAQALLDANADVHAKAKDGMTPLIFTAQKDMPALARALLEANADPNAQKTTGAAALFVAAQNGSTDVARALVEDGRTEVDLANLAGCTPLWIASREGKLPMVNLLLQADANVDKTPHHMDLPANERATPLCIAVQGGFPLVAQALLCARADPNAAAADGMTPLRAALRDGNLQPSPAALLIRCGAGAHAFPKLDYSTNKNRDVGLTNYTLKRTGKVIDPGPTSVFQAMNNLNQMGLAVTLQDVAEDVKAQPELSAATLTVLGYAPEMRPFLAVQSGNLIQVEAWLQLLERPRDMNQELELFGYNVFSLACDLGNLDMVRHLLELCLDGDQRIDTSAVTFLGLTGWDLAKEYAAQLPEDKSRQEIVALLEEWSHKEHFGPDDPNKLREEAKRNLSRPPIESAPVERPEISFIRLGFWQGGIVVAVKVAEGAFGLVLRIPIWPPVRDGSGKLHFEVIVKVTKVAGSGSAVDTAKSMSADEEAEIKALTNEICTLRKVNHRNIVTTFGFTYGKLKGAEQSSYMLLLERCDCDLGSLIYPKAGSEEDGQLSAPLMMKIATEMADGLAYLHSRGIKHLDMKPGNVLMVREPGSQGWSVRIADFGMQDDKEDDDDRQSKDDDEVYGTWEYMAPECLSRKHGRPAFASDVYSVAIILWELWTKRRVYTGFCNLEENTVWDKETEQHRVDVKLVAKRMASGGQRPELPAECPMLWSLLMQACWEAAIDARPTFAQMLAVLKAMADDPSWAEPPPADEAEAPAQAPAEPAEPKADGPSLADWLAGIGLQEHLSLISGYVSTSSQLEDLRGMLVSEQEDDEEEDLKDLVGEMELDEEAAASFRVAVGSIVLAAPEPEPEPEPELEPEPKPEANAGWSSLLTKLGLGGNESLAEVGKQTQDDETRRLRVAILDAEQEEAKMAAVDSLIAKKDEEKDAALALAAEKDAEIRRKDAEIEQLKQLARER